MLKHWKILILIFVSLNSSVTQAFAYIDPGTMSSIFSSLFPLLVGILGAALGFVIWPIRRFSRYLNDKWHQKRKGLVFFISGIIVLAFLAIVAAVCVLLFF